MELQNLHGPRQAFRVETPNELYQYFRRIIDAKRIKEWIYAGRPVAIHVSESRVCLDCAACNSGCSVSLEWRVAYCGDCGAVYRSEVLDVPSDQDLVEADRVLGDRPVINRNWYPAGHRATRFVAETVEDLKEENLEMQSQLLSQEEV